MGFSGRESPLKTSAGCLGCFGWLSPGRCCEPWDLSKLRSWRVNNEETWRILDNVFCKVGSAYLGSHLIYIYIYTRHPMRTEIWPPNQDLRKSGLKVVLVPHFSCFNGIVVLVRVWTQILVLKDFLRVSVPKLSKSTFLTARQHWVESFHNTCTATLHAKHWNDMYNPKTKNNSKSIYCGFHIMLFDGFCSWQLPTLIYTLSFQCFHSVVTNTNPSSKEPAFLRCEPRKNTKVYVLQWKIWPNRPTQ